MAKRTISYLMRGHALMYKYTHMLVDTHIRCCALLRSHHYVDLRFRPNDPTKSEGMIPILFFAKDTREHTRSQEQTRHYHCAAMTGRSKQPPSILM